MDGNGDGVEYEQVYSQDDVQVHINGPIRDHTAVYCGQLSIKEERRVGALVEWQAIQEIEPPQNPDISFDGDVSDWEEVTALSAVGYTNNSDTVEISSPKKKAKPVVFEVSDIKSYKLSEESGMTQIKFSLRDGSTLPSFIFGNCDHRRFFRALEKYVTFKCSKKDPSLFLVFNPAKDVEALQKSFRELDIFNDQYHEFFGMTKDITLGSFYKVTSIVRSILMPEDNRVLQCSNRELTEFLESLPSNHVENIIHQQHEETGFEVITCMELPPRPNVTRSEPVSPHEWLSHFGADGRIKDAEQLKKKIFKGGVALPIRCEVWKFLLGSYCYNSTQKSREQHKKLKIEEYYQMKLQWKSISTDQESRWSSLRDKKNLVEKDVNRTDRVHPYFSGENNKNVQMMNDILMTYCMYNFDLGYVQGMSDLLSPIMVLMDSEPESFWCFVGFIQKVEGNFELSQEKMKVQLQQLSVLIHFLQPQFSDYLDMHDSGNLYFFFRWLLVWFKRELEFEDVMKLWEVLWTELPCKNFNLLVCIAALEKEKNAITENNFGLSEIIKHINDMAYHMDIDEILCCAESLYLQLLECKQLPQEIHDILGIPVKEGTIESRPISLQTSTPLSNPIPRRPQEDKRRQDYSPNSNNSIEVLSDDPDMESRFDFSFGMFT